jgi:hypothetical protein
MADLTEQKVVEAQAEAADKKKKIIKVVVIVAVLVIGFWLAKKYLL